MTEEPKAGKSVIMIVDDQPANLKVLSDLLVQYEFDVLVAKDGQKALQNLKKIKPDLILLDILMPNLDGFETCQALKANPDTQDIPVIFMSALSDPVDKIKGLTLGAVDYITKPFQQEEVITRVNIHLRLRSLTQQLSRQNEELRREIRQRQIAEASLRQSEEKFAKAFRSNPGPMILTTLEETRLIEVNQMFCQITGYPLEAVLGKTAAELNLWRDPQDWDNLLARLQRQGSVYRQEIAIFDRAGELKYLLVSAELLSLNQVPHVLAMTYDITECKRVAAELVTNEAKYRLLVESSVILIWSADRECRLTFVNPAVQTILGYSPAELLDIPLSQLAATPETQAADQAAFERVLAGQSLVNYESFYRSRQGETVPLLLNALPIRDPEGEILGLVGTGYDLRERLRSEEQSHLYAEAQAEIKALNRLNRLKDEFVATLSHALRTPLATVQMALKMIPQARDEQQRQRYYQTALAACEKETRLINDLLDFQTLELGNYQPTWQTIDLQKWIEPLLQVFQSRAQQANLTFQTNMDASLHPLRVDAYLLKRILEELLTNACTYTQRGGQITLTLTSQPGHALIQVENTATKFRRLASEDPWQYGGTGLGLALVKKMSDVLRARIEVNSQDNCTRFQLLLPRE
ncbi:MAG: PAS domain S-box protein [Thermostichales cyanobacterium DRC_bins_46]